MQKQEGGSVENAKKICYTYIATDIDISKRIRKIRHSDPADRPGIEKPAAHRRGKANAEIKRIGRQHIYRQTHLWEETLRQQGAVPSECGCNEYIHCEGLYEILQEMRKSVGRRCFVLL